MRGGGNCQRNALSVYVGHSAGERQYGWQCRTYDGFRLKQALGGGKHVGASFIEHKPLQCLGRRAVPVHLSFFARPADACI